MRPWFVRVAAPFWAAMYITLFKGFGAAIFVSAQLLWGLWIAVVLMIFLYGIWGTIFYIILLQSDSFEHFKDSVENFLKNKQGKLFVWIRAKFSDDSECSSVSPFLIMLVFIAESPLTGVPFIRLAYSKDKIWTGLFWVWMGAVIEVVTWFLPIYGGGISLIKGAFAWMR